MKELLTVAVVGSFFRQQKGHYTLHALIKVSNDSGPVVGLTAANFVVKMGTWEAGKAVIEAHTDTAQFPGLYTLTENFDVALFDVPILLGLLLCVRVSQGTQVGTGIVSLTQIRPD
jgi:hypothetical protein